MSGIALPGIEGLWWTPEQKPKCPSVLSFLEGLGSVRGDFNISYANFYEKTGFRRAPSRSRNKRALIPFFYRCNGISSNSAEKRQQNCITRFCRSGMPQDRVTGLIRKG
jgi:hypothetical protein